MNALLFGNIHSNEMHKIIYYLSKLNVCNRENENSSFNKIKFQCKNISHTRISTIS